MQEIERDETKWLALLIRQGLLLIVKGIERRYQIGEHKCEKVA